MVQLSIGQKAVVVSIMVLLDIGLLFTFLAGGMLIKFVAGMGLFSTIPSTLWIFKL
jgi:hypothetical protein